MKNYQRGFVAILLISIVTLLIIGGGAYVYKNLKTESSIETKSYMNQTYGYTFKYPATYFAFEWPGQYKGEKPNLVTDVGTKASVLFTTHNLLNEASDSSDYLNSPWIRISHENGTAWVSGSKSVDDFWSKISKTDDKGQVVNTFISKENIDGVDFIIFSQKGWDISSQSYPQSLQAVFMHNNNFFWVSSAPQLDQDIFYAFIRSFVSNSSTMSRNNTTYTNYGFTIQYPLNWIINEDPRAQNTTIEIRSPEHDKYLRDNPNVPYQGQYNDIVIAVHGYPWTDYNSSSVKSVMLNGINALKYDYSGVYEAETYIVSDNQTKTFTITSISLPIDAAIRKNIISSFALTN